MDLLLTIFHSQSEWFCPWDFLLNSHLRESLHKQKVHNLLFLCEKDDLVEQLKTIVVFNTIDDFFDW